MPFKMKKSEHDTYFSAYSNSKGTSDKARTADAQAAVVARRDRDKGALKAVNKGIQQGSLRGLISKRQKAIDEAG